MTFRSSSAFAFLLLVGGCSGRTSSEPAPAPAPAPGPSAATSVTCDGAKADGLLGSWLTYEDGPSAYADEVTKIPVTRAFCGTQTSGTFRWAQDWVDPEQCRQVFDLGGTFTFDGHDLALIVTSGFDATHCPGYDQNRPVDEPQRTIHFEAKVAGDQLVLSTGSGAGQGEETYQRQAVTHQ